MADKSSMTKGNVLLLSLWVAFLIAGFGALEIYSNTPGEPGLAIRQWPATSQLKPHSDLPSLLVFLHPKCSCSRATLGELERLYPTLIGKANITFIFYKPLDQSDDWVKNSYWDMTQVYDGAERWIDAGGIEAERFGVRTSGQVALYDPTGHLVFRGGITPARGHMGDSTGREAILAYFHGEDLTDKQQTPVFGCAIRKSEIADSK